MSPVHQFRFGVSEEHIDRNGHVNNVVYVQWMQDAAIHHSEASGCARASRNANAIWVVRSHYVTYLKPAFSGDEIVALTWVCDFRRAVSLRKYRFLRSGDNAVLSTGTTEWVFVDAVSGHPRIIPDSVRHTFILAPSDFEP
jgi:acyl-CoA thioester hydrolase